MRKTIILAVSVVLLFSFAFAGCNATADTPNADNSADTAVSGNPANTEPELEKPQSFGLVPASTKGLAVYGSGELKAGSDKVTVEIDTVDLEKIEMGAKVSLTNLSDMSNPVIYQGSVSALPESVSENDDICYIEVTLEIDEAGGVTPELPEESEASSDDPPASDNTTTSSSVGFSTSSCLPASDMSVETTIYLSSKEGVFTVLTSCLQESADGQSYVWAAEADNPQDIKPDDLVPTKVETGETDGELIEILSGLSENSYIAMPI